ncbi:DUF116 domain-containing protein [Candidatus Omnitrophota bacterium]
MIGFIIKINNFLIRCFRRNYPSDKVMILLPHCLQLSGCSASVVQSIDNCKRCKKCGIADIAFECEEKDIKVFIASGGELAISEIKKTRPKFIIAVACNKELILGLFSIFPLPVYAIENERPNGPCKDTVVNVVRLKWVINRFIISKNKSS